jgi:hypothetical protein
MQQTHTTSSLLPHSTAGLVTPGTMLLLLLLLLFYLLTILLCCQLPLLVPLRQA